MKLPKISIVIPSYNKVDYIGETLESIFSQNYPNLEVVVQDGGSSDGTLEIIKKYAKKYPETFKWESKKDKGQTDAIKKGFKKATGDVFAYINADDVYEKDALFSVGRYFLKHKQTKWLVGEGKVIDGRGMELLNFVTFYKSKLLRINSFLILLVTNYFMQPSVFLGRKLYKQYGPFKGNKNFVLEYDMWLRISKDNMPDVLSKSLSAFRLTKEAKSTTLTKAILKGDYQLVARYTKNPMILFLHFIHNMGRLAISALFL